MSARQRRFWWAAGIIGAVVGGVTIVYLWATNSIGGRRWLLAKLVATLDGGFKGRGHLRVGTLKSVGWGRFALDSVSIVDTAGVPVVYIARASGRLDFGALYNQRVHVRSLDVQGVQLNLHKDLQGPWNLAYIISGDTTAKIPGPPGYADNIRIDTLRLSSGTITTIAPWQPNQVFQGRARDSVIALRDSLHDLIRTPNGNFERRQYQLDRVVGYNGIITQPTRALSSMDIDSLRGVVTDPPVRILAAAGRVRWTPDSALLDLPKMTLPASQGSVAGKVWWSEPGAVRFDVTIKAQAGLSDLGWIWDVLPDSGRGTATVRMRTLASADDAEYSLTDLDVSSTGSHVTGRINVVVRPAEVLLQKVNLAFAPLRSDLLRRLSYDAVPENVKGSLTGRLVAESGGPLTNFLIDLVDARFADSNVPGAVSKLRANGLVTFGVAPAAKNVVVQSLDADLRSARALSPTLPALDGRVSGTGRIVAADLKTADLRAMRLMWTDAAGNVSAVTGDARIGYGLRVPTIRADLMLDPISLRALARIDTTLTVRSALGGRVTANGTLDSLVWHAALHADSVGKVVLDGTASLQRLTWRATADGTLEALNTRRWLGREDVPVTSLNGTVQLAAAGTRDTAGGFFVDEARGVTALKQAEAAERPAFDFQASASLDKQKLHVDSAAMHLGGITLDAHGTLARQGVVRDTSTLVLADSANRMSRGAPDTLEVSARADTLETVRRQLTRLAATIAPFDTAGAESLRKFAADTIKGDASVSGYLVGSVKDFDATLALGARDVQVGAIRVGRVFGSLRALDVLTRPTFEGVATADAIDGIGAARIASTEFRVQRANPDSGQLILDASSANNAHLIVRGGYLRKEGTTTVVADSLRFAYDSVTWLNRIPIRVVSDAQGLRIDTLEIRSSANGVFSMRGDIPREGQLQGVLHLERFPIGEAVAFGLGTRRFSGGLTGDATLAGTRAMPIIDWQIDGDSLGFDGNYLPRVNSDGHYSDKKVVLQAVVKDSLGGSIRAEARVPMDLAIATVEKRLLSDNVDADVTADSLRLEALGLTVAGVTRIRGSVVGRVSVSGPMDRPIATGQMSLDNFSAFARELGIEPYEGRATIRAAQDSLILESFRVRSGGARDTIGIRGALRYAKDEPIKIDASLSANNAILARQRNGTNLVLSGNVDVRGDLKKPAVSGSIFVPSAILMIDPLGASTALDLTSETARGYLTATEIPVLESSSASMASLGQFATVTNMRVDLGSDVWVRTPESRIKLTGGVRLATQGDALVPEGEILAERGQYRLDLSVVQRTFTIDSGRVRFLGVAALPPTLDITATNIVRLAQGDEIPVGVHIGGTIDRPLLTLSSSDQLYASAPESEIISLLIFGAPTFALDGQSQSTVKAVTGVLLPTVGGAVEGILQRLLPGFNTVQITTAGGQDKDLSATSLLDNVALSAGKQLGPRAYLRLNTGLCRNAGRAAGTAWGGVAVEYRLSQGLTGQVGVDPGSAPCSRPSGTTTNILYQFGFDLFREWIF